MGRVHRLLLLLIINRLLLRLMRRERCRERWRVRRGHGLWHWHRRVRRRVVGPAGHRRAGVPLLWRMLVMIIVLLLLCRERCGAHKILLVAALVHRGCWLMAGVLEGRRG